MVPFPLRQASEQSVWEGAQLGHLPGTESPRAEQGTSEAFVSGPQTVKCKETRQACACQKFSLQLRKWELSTRFSTRNSQPGGPATRQGLLRALGQRGCKRAPLQGTLRGTLSPTQLEGWGENQCRHRVGCDPPLLLTAGWPWG